MKEQKKCEKKQKQNFMVIDFLGHFSDFLDFLFQYKYKYCTNICIYR